MMLRELLDLVDQTGRLADVLVDERNDDGPGSIRSDVAEGLPFGGAGDVVNVKRGHVLARLQAGAHRSRERGRRQGPGQQHGGHGSAPLIHSGSSPFFAVPTVPW